jgi:ferredoxin
MVANLQLKPNQGKEAPVLSSFTEEFRSYCRSRGADLVGIASPDRFDGVAPQNNPLSIFPDATAVVVIGRRITRGSLRGWEEGTNRDIYEMFGYSWLDKQFLALTTFEAGEWLEDRGWEATPVMAYPPETPAQGVPLRVGQPGPNVNLDMNYAAVAAGLGEIGLHGVFLSPQFGPRQRFQVVLTDAPLEADPLYEGELCGSCNVCVSSCPLGAIDADNCEDVVVAGKHMRVAKVDYNLCRRCQNGARGNAYHPTGKPDRIAAVCTRSCVDMLERGDKLECKFHLAFRQREPWGLNELGQNVKVELKATGGGCADPEGFRKSDP